MDSVRDNTTHQRLLEVDLTVAEISAAIVRAAMEKADTTSRALPTPEIEFYTSGRVPYEGLQPLTVSLLFDLMPGAYAVDEGTERL